MPVDIPKIPEGLEDLMKGLSKAVLKERPNNIIEFAAKYFEGLLKERDGGLMKNYEIFESLDRCRLYTKKSGVAKYVSKSETVIPNADSKGPEKPPTKSPVLFGDPVSETSETKTKVNELIGQGQQRGRSRKSAKTSGKNANLKSITEESTPEIPPPLNEEMKNLETETAAIKIQHEFRKFLKRNVEKIDNGLSSTTITPKIGGNGNIEMGEEATATIIQNNSSELEKPLNTQTKKVNEVEDSKSLLEYLDEEDKARIEEMRLSVDKAKINNQNTNSEVFDMKDLELDEAATKIQKTYRGYKSRKENRLQKQINNNDLENVGKIISNVSDVVSTPKIHNDKNTDKNEDEQNKAAIKIQSTYRGHVDRNKINDMKLNQNQDKTDEDAMISTTKLKNDTEEEAAVKIQSTYRGHMARNEVKKMKSTEKIDNKLENNSDNISEGNIDIKKIQTPDEAALKIQSTYRGHLARNEVKKMKTTENEINKNQNRDKTDEDAMISTTNLKNDTEDAAAVKIQSTYRGHLARNEVKKMKSTKKIDNKSKNNSDNISEGNIDIKKIQTPDEAALKIQSTYRGHVAREEVKKMKSMQNEDVEKDKLHRSDSKKVPTDEEAAIKIQSTYRGYVARNEVKKMKSIEKDVLVKEINGTTNPNNDVKKIEDEAALKIQSTYRGHIVRKEVKKMKSKENEDLPHNNLLTNEKPIKTNKQPTEDEAAIIIQSTYRGHVVRNELKKNKSVGKEDVKDKESENLSPEDVKKKLTEDDAAVKIQSSYRGHIVRNELKKIKSIEHENLIEVNHLKTETTEYPKNKQTEDEAAIKIQSAYRGHVARNEVKKMKSLERDIIDKENKSVSEKSIVNVVEKTPNEDEAALKIQSTYRGHLARNEVKAMKLNQNENDNNSEKNIDQNESKKLPNEDEAAIQIQSAYRGHLARNEVKRMKSLEKPTITTEKPFAEVPSKKIPTKDEAALKIQSSYRGHAVRKELRKLTSNEINSDAVDGGVFKNQNKPNEDEAALKIQSAYRGHLARNEVNDMKSTNKEVVAKIDANETNKILAEDEAATKIQSTYRGHLARNEVKAMKSNLKDNGNNSEKNIDENESKKLTNEEEAAIQIQSAYRGHLARNEVKRMKSYETDAIIPVETSLKNLLTEDDAAIKIQSSYRGHLARNEVKKIEEHNLELKNPEETTSQNGKTLTTDEKTANAIPSHGIKTPPNEDAAAIKIQSTYRGHLARNQVNKMKSIECENKSKNMDLKLPIEDEAAIKIQSAYRGHIARNEVKKLKSIEKEKTYMDYSGKPKPSNSNDISKFPTEHEAALKIQTTFRAHLMKVNQIKAAVKIQSGYRGHKARVLAKKKKDDQKHSNRMISPKSNVLLKTNKNVNIIEEKIPTIIEPNLDEAAVKIQTSYRGHKARKEFQEIKKMYDNRKSYEDKFGEDKFYIQRTFSERELRILMSAAIKIQKIFRGYKCRKNFAETLKNFQATNFKNLKIVKPTSAKLIDLIDEDDELQRDGTVDDENEDLPKSASRGKKVRQEFKEKKEKVTQSKTVTKVQKKSAGQPPKKGSGKKTVTDSIDIEALQKRGSFLDDGKKSNLIEFNVRKPKPKDQAKSQLKTKLIKEQVQVLAKPDADEAAQKIQKTFRGYQARKNLKNKKIEEQKRNDAAQNIQKTFRGYQARKQYDFRRQKKNGENIGLSQKLNMDELESRFSRLRSNPNTARDENEIAKVNEIEKKLPNTIEPVNTKVILNNQEKVPQESKIPVVKPVHEKKKLSSRSNTSKTLSKDDSIKSTKEKYAKKKPLPKQNSLRLVKSEPQNRSIDSSKSNKDEKEKNKPPKKPSKSRDLSTSRSKKSDSDEIIEKKNISKQHAKEKVHSKSKVIKPTPKVDVESATDIENNVILKQEPLPNEKSLPTDLDMAAVKIQKSYRGHIVRKDLKNQNLTEPDNDSLLAPAATTIQKNYRGYHTRKMIKEEQLKKMNVPTLEEFYKDVKFSQSTINAVINIQKMFRGYMVRKEFRNRLLQKEKVDISDDESKFTDSLEPNVETKIVSEMEDDSLENLNIEFYGEEPAKILNTIEKSGVNEEPSKKKYISKLTTLLQENSKSIENDLENVDADLNEDEQLEEKPKVIFDLSPDDPPSLSGLTKEELAEIERMDLSKFESDSIEAMYYSLRKNEILLDKMHRRESQTSIKQNNDKPDDAEIDKSKQISQMGESENCDVVMGTDLDFNTQDQPGGMKKSVRSTNLAELVKQDSEDIVMRPVKIDFGNSIERNIKSRPSIDDDADVQFYEDGKKITHHKTVRTQMQYESNSSFRIEEKEREPGDGASVTSENPLDISQITYSVDGSEIRGHITEPRELLSNDHPMIYAQRKIDEFLNQIHGNSEINSNEEYLQRIYTHEGYTREHHETTEEDDVVEEISTQYPHGKKLISAVSEADSDYYEPNKMKPFKDDFNISTALDNYGSTDSESTIISAATKIQAGARGFITRRRLQSMGKNTISISERRPSFGNAAIDQSLDEMIEANERDQSEINFEKFRMERQRLQMRAQTTFHEGSSMYHSSDDEMYGIRDIKLEQRILDESMHDPNKSPTDSGNESTNSTEKQINNEKDVKSVDANENNFNADIDVIKNTIIINNGDSSIDEYVPVRRNRSANRRNEKLLGLNLEDLEGVAARRLTLQRGDAFQGTSTPEDDEYKQFFMNTLNESDETKKSNESRTTNSSSQLDGEQISISKSNSSTGDQGVLNRSSNSLPEMNAIPKKRFGLLTRQRTMPVQIETDILRAVPKHLRKRIKSADSLKRK